MTKILKKRTKKILALHLNLMSILKSVKEGRIVKRKWWVHPVWRERREQGDYQNLVSPQISMNGGGLQSIYKITSERPDQVGD